jgi:hypothetical protein
MSPTFAKLFYPEQRCAAELLDRFEGLVHSYANESLIAETHDALVKLIGDLCDRREQWQSKHSE